MISVLSTKILNPYYKTLLPESIDYSEYEGITIQPLPFNDNSIVENAIVTSQNAVAILTASNTRIKDLFCVGSKTKQLLEANNYSVKECCKSGLDLATLITKKYSEKSFTYFCGNLRRNELPNILLDHKIFLKERIIYQTIINQTHSNLNVDYLLCFSPSGVLSAFNSGVNVNTCVICIGRTTASKAKTYFKKVIYSSTQDVEGVIKLLQYSLK